MLEFCKIYEKLKIPEFLLNLLTFAKCNENVGNIFDKEIEIAELCKGVYCVDLSENSTLTPTNIYFQKSAFFKTAKNETSKVCPLTQPSLRRRRAKGGPNPALRADFRV